MVQDVHPTEPQKAIMAFWPLGIGQGEPNELQFRSGRIDFCVRRVNADVALRKLFGSSAAALAALCQYEFCLELNSSLAVNNKDVLTRAAELRPDGTSFYFWPSLIAFTFEHLYQLAETIYAEIQKGKPELLGLILYDPEWATVFRLPSVGDPIFIDLLVGLVRDQSGLFIETRRFPPMNFWPKDIQEALKRYKDKK